MIVLPYVELPIWEKPVPVDVQSSLDGLEEVILDICHIAKDSNKYYFQIGFYYKGSVYTSKDLIKQVHSDFLSFLPTMPIIEVGEIRLHIDYYCNRINIIPAWGVDSYYDLIAKEKTPRRLDGPHKAGMLKKGEARMVAFKDDKSLAYGPTIEYLRKLDSLQEKSK